MERDGKRRPPRLGPVYAALVLEPDQLADVVVQASAAAAAAAPAPRQRDDRDRDRDRDREARDRERAEARRQQSSADKEYERYERERERNVYRSSTQQQLAPAATGNPALTSTQIEHPYGASGSVAPIPPSSAMRSPPPASYQPQQPSRSRSDHYGNDMRVNNDRLGPVRDEYNLPATPVKQTQPPQASRPAEDIDHKPRPWWRCC